MKSMITMMMITMMMISITWIKMTLMIILILLVSWISIQRRSPLPSIFSIPDFYISDQNLIFKCHGWKLTMSDMSLQSWMHKESKHGYKSFKCDKCDYVSSRDQYLKKHVRDQHANDIFNCDLCDYSWHSKSTLQGHVKSVHSNASYQCQKCDHIAKRQSSLTCHIRTKHELISFRFRDTDTGSCPEVKAKIHIVIFGFVKL